MQSKFKAANLSATLAHVPARKFIRHARTRPSRGWRYSGARQTSSISGLASRLGACSGPPPECRPAPHVLTQLRFPAHVLPNDVSLCRVRRGALGYPPLGRFTLVGRSVGSKSALNLTRHYTYYVLSSLSWSTNGRMAV